MNKSLRIAKIFLGWPVSIIALVFIFKLLLGKTGMITPNISQINIPVLTLGIICYVCFFFLRSFVWKKILLLKGYDLPLKEVSFLWGSSEFKRYVPGNIWSFLGRAVQFSQRGVPKKIIGSCLLIEIQFFLLGCFIVSLLSVSFLIYNFLPSIFHNQFYVLMSFSLVFLFSFLVLSFKNLPLKLPNIFKHLFVDFSLYNNLLLIAFSVFYMFIYGLGTYFVIVSFLFLSPAYILTFIGFFVFSLLAGYLSLVTPMGLGVREGIMIIGLSKFISAEASVFSSIFSRVILIISELIFITLAFLWKHAKFNTFLKIENALKTYSHQTILAVGMLSYTIYFTAASFLRYDNFYTGRFDLGNMAQTAWNTVNGRIFQLTDPNGTEIISRLAFHADFILILISPFYLLWSDPRILLFIQTITLSLGALFVYLIAREVIKNKNVALVFSFLYLLNPALQFVNLYDFHPVALATTFLLATFYFLLKKRFILFLIFALLAAFTKEQVWIIVSIFGLYLFLPQLIFLIKKKKFIKKELTLGLVIFAFSFLIFYYLIWQAIPQARGNTQHFALSYYSEFGDSPTNVIKNIATSPQKIFWLMTQNGRVFYLEQLFSPLGYLSILSPLTLIFALPDFLINLLSNNSQLHQIYFQYTSAITPFIFISVIYAVGKIKKRIPRIPYYVLSLYLITATLYAAYSFGPLPGAKNPNLDMFIKTQAYREVIDDFLMRIPKEYSVAATNNLGSHLSHREFIYTIPIGIDKADFVIFLLNDPYAQPSLNAQKEMAKKLSENKNYEEVLRRGDFVALRRR